MRRLVAALFVLVIAFFFFGGRAHASQEPAHDEPQVASGGSHTMRVGVHSFGTAFSHGTSTVHFQLDATF